MDSPARTSGARKRSRSMSGSGAVRSCTTNHANSATAIPSNPIVGSDSQP